MASRKRGINPSKIQDFRGGSTYTGTERIEQERDRIREGRDASFPTTTLSEIPWVPGNNHPPDESSRVEAFRYAALEGANENIGYTGTLFVRFIKHGTPWKYLNVPSHIYQSFASAQSKGRYINSVLNNFPNSRASGDEESTFFVQSQM